MTAKNCSDKYKSNKSLYGYIKIHIELNDFETMAIQHKMKKVLCNGEALNEMCINCRYSGCFCLNKIKLFYTSTD